MPKLTPKFELDRCPHCGVHKPHLNQISIAQTTSHDGKNVRNWMVYSCQGCGGLVTAYSHQQQGDAVEWYPKSDVVDPDVPPEVAHYLQQAKDTLHAPDGSIMLAASAVDAMLKLKGYKRDTLNDRIDKAAKKHLITDDMARWAHEVRLDANAPRHADQKHGAPDLEDAKRVLNFAETLAEILFALPARVTRGRQPKAP